MADDAGEPVDVLRIDDGPEHAELTAVDRSRLAVAAAGLATPSRRRGGDG